MQQLESLAYEAKPVQAQRQQVYVVSDLESLSASALYYGDGSSSGSSSGFGGGFGGFGGIDEKDRKKYGIAKTPSMKNNLPNVESVRIAKNTEYFNLSNIGSQTIGITHHSTGLGKLKIHEKETDIEYGLLIKDILNKPLKDWKIDKK